MKLRTALVVTLFGALAVPASAQRVKVRDHRKKDKEEEERIRVPARPSPPPQAQPVILRFSPTFGAPGTRVEIEGNNFASGDQVLLGQRPLAIAELGPNRIVVTIPEGATSDYFVVARPGGKQDRSKTRFEVRRPPPTIAAFAPTSGPPGTVVKVTGANFSPADRVTYGHAPMEVVARAETWIDVRVPAQARRDEPIVVRGEGGEARTAMPFQLVLPPTIVRFSPLWGPPGTRVEIVGHHFARGDEVRMNGRPMRIHELDERRIVVEVAADAKTDTLAIFRGGVEVEVSRRPFEVLAPPRLTSFAPTAGPPGTKVTLQGSGLADRPRVFYGVELVRPVAVSDTTIEVLVPPGATSQPFRVETRAGEATTAQAFQVQIPSEVTSVSPTSGPVGTRVWIKGRHFNPTDAFFLGGLPLPIVERQPEGYVVEVPRGAQSGVIAWESYGRRQETRFRFEVLVPPTIAEFSPSRGPVGTEVTVTGANFTDKTEVRFGGKPCPVVRRVAPTQIVVTIPPGAFGTDYLWVEDAGQRVKSHRTFEVIPPPSIAGFVPASGPVGTHVTVTGAHFTATTVVKLGAIPMPIVKAQPPTSITVAVPADARGADHIWVEDGGQRAKSAGVFTVIVPPAIAQVAPPSGPVGTEVTITGERFSPRATVWFGSLACPIVRRVGSTALVVKIPVGARGKQPLVVEDLGQRVASAQPFEVIEPPPPPPPPAGHPDHDHAHEHPHEIGDHHHHPHVHPHKPGKNHHHPM